MRRERALELLLEQRAKILGDTHRRRRESEQATREAKQRLAWLEAELGESAARGWLGAPASSRAHRERVSEARAGAFHELTLAVESCRVHEEGERAARRRWVVARRLASCPPR